MKPLIALVGPTASGKSALGVALARECGGFVISADSRQIYRGMNVATGKLTREEMAGVRHEMIDIADPDQEFTLAQYQERAYQLIQNSSSPVFLVGGTGLYINAVCDGYVIPRVAPDPALRAELARKSPAELVEIIRIHDPEIVACIDQDNKQRLLRYAEIVLSGQKLSTGYEQRRPDWIRVLKIGLEVPRDELYARINRRVDDMFAGDQIITEACALLTRYSSDLPSMTGIGYLRIRDYLAGAITLDTCKELIKRDSRRYAKRQLTWFRADQEIKWVRTADEARALAINFLTTTTF